MKTRHTSALVIVAALVAAAGGCQGHGKYTQEHVDASRQRIDDLKSANEFQMAESAFLAGELEKALTKVEVSIELNPEVARSQVLKGRILTEMNRLTDALACFARAEELEADNVDAQYYQGVIAERVQNQDEALKRYTRSAELSPSNPQFALATAEMLIDMGRTPDAEVFLKAREETFRLDGGIQQLLGHMAMMRGDYDGAVGRFNQARILAPDDQATTEDLVGALMQVENWSEADFYLSAMLRKSENETRRDLMHLRVQCLQELNRPVEARDVLLKLTAGNGATDTQAWIALGNVSLQLRDLARVREAGVRVAGLAPNRADGFILKALWSRHMGDYSAALNSLDDALDVAPGDTSIRVMQALVLVDAGRTDLAIRELQTALRADPGYEPAQATLAELMRQASAGEN